MQITLSNPFLLHLPHRQTMAKQHSYYFLFNIALVLDLLCLMTLACFLNNSDSSLADLRSPVVVLPVCASAFSHVVSLLLERLLQVEDSIILCASLGWKSDFRSLKCIISRDYVVSNMWYQKGFVPSEYFWSVFPVWGRLWWLRLALISEVNHCWTLNMFFFFVLFLSDSILKLQMCCWLLLLILSDRACLSTFNSISISIQGFVPEYTFSYLTLTNILQTASCISV